MLEYIALAETKTEGDAVLALFLKPLSREARLQCSTLIALGAMAVAATGWAQKPREQITPIYSAEELRQITPTSPNPYLAFLPEGVEPDWDYWDSWMRLERDRRIAARGPRAGVPVTDNEPNDSILHPQVLANFGTGEGQTNEVAITGAAVFPPGNNNPEPLEDNGSIVYAHTTPLSATNGFFAVSGEIGNGPFGSGGFATGDYDFYRIQNVAAGRVIEAQVDASRFGSSLDAGLAVYSASGQLLEFERNDITVLVGNEEIVLNPDPSVRVTAPSFGDYYVAVFGEPIRTDNGPPISEQPPSSVLLSNPFSSQTGPARFIGSNYTHTEGIYDLYIRLHSAVPSPVENNGSINLATAVPSTGGVYSSVLGDGVFGNSSGDFDFYGVQNLKRGDLLIADIDATGLGSTLDSFLAVWDSTGKLVAWNEDDPFQRFLFTVDESLFQFTEFDSFVAYEIPADGTYYVSVGSFFSPYPTDPFDASSGPGAATTGPYQLALRIQPHDPDVYAMDLEAGDVVGADMSLFHGNLELLDPTGALIVDSHVNLGAIYSANSPLPVSESSALGYVIPKDGRYFIRCSSYGRGNYSANISVHRPALESPDNPEPRQRLFIDFDGVLQFDNSIFDPPVPKVADISGLDAALSRWELEPEDEDAVIDAILAVVQESLKLDLLHPHGLNPLFDIEILNSRDHEDPWGNPDVSRVIVGGTVNQLGIPTIGIAQSVDIGNFDTQESAIVLLDLLSAPATDPNSLNGIPRDLSRTIVDLIGEAVGNIVAHEAGHFFGDFHTENFITAPNIMDQGGNLANTIGLGPDGIFGTADDINVDFGVDQYAFLEGFTGFEDTLNLIALSLSAPPGSVLYVNFNRATDGIGTLARPFNNMFSALQNVPHAGTLRVFPGESNELFFGAEAVNQRVTIERAGTSSLTAVIGRQ